MKFSNFKSTIKYMGATAAIACAFVLPQVSHAQVEIPQGSGFARLEAGLAKPKDTDARFGFGGELGLKFANNVGVGAMFLASSANGVKLFHYGLGADYYFDQQIPGLRAGAVIGLATASASALGKTVSKTKFMLGPRVGYDYVISAPVSVGVEVGFPITFGDNAGGTLYALANVRYAF